jgi:UPF0716 family protein affecting phage T7 exclusion
LGFTTGAVVVVAAVLVVVVGVVAAVVLELLLLAPPHPAMASASASATVIGRARLTGHTPVIATTIVPQVTHRLDGYHDDGPPAGGDARPW